MLLNTGLFLNEAADLQIDSVDWDKKQLKVSGDRNRILSLDDQTFTALARWSKERVDSSVTHLFTTSKGSLQPLSERSIDHLIRKYAVQAKLNRTVNAQVLRNTFAVRLCKEESNTATLLNILGLQDPDGLKRYKDLPEENVMPISNDTRSWKERLASKLFPVKPKASKPLQAIDGFCSPDPEELIIGRDSIIKDLKSNLSHGQSMLLTGPIGIGKTHLLKHMKMVLPNILYLASPSPVKPMLIAVYQTCEQETELSPKLTTQDLLERITHTIPASRPVLLIDNLGKLKLPDMDLFLQLLEHFTVLGAAEETPTRLNPIWWKFKEKELPALSDETSKTLIRHLTQNMPISDYDMLENKLLTLANGVPLAMVDMAKQLSHRPVATREAVRDLYHEAGIRYRCWSNAFIVFWAGLVMFRFIALGTHSFEGYILAGMGTSFLMVFRHMKTKR